MDVGQCTGNPKRADVVEMCSLLRGIRSTYTQAAYQKTFYQNLHNELCGFGPSPYTPASNDR